LSFYLLSALRQWAHISMLPLARLEIRQKSGALLVDFKISMALNLHKATMMVFMLWSLDYLGALHSFSNGRC